MLRADWGHPGGVHGECMLARDGGSRAGLEDGDEQVKQVVSLLLGHYHGQG